MFQPQPGPQEQFLASSADLVFFGGAAGGSKTYGLLLEPMRHVHRKGFDTVIFRRTTKQVMIAGGLWDTSREIYQDSGATPIESRAKWAWPSGATVRFQHMELESDRFDHQGGQYALIGFDELTHFTWKQFSYMFSRNRTACGIRAYMRCTCNPMPEDDKDAGWIHRYVSWYIDPETGYAIPERSGVVRWFVMFNDEIVWADSKEELERKYGHDCRPKSFTFIKSSVYDNKILLQANPDYLASLQALPLLERERLLYGNWKIRPTAGTVFREEWFEVVPAAPAGLKSVRTWDRAGTEPNPSNPNPDWTVGLKIGKTANGIYYVDHINRLQGTPQKVEQAILNTASQDGHGVTILLIQDPGVAGKDDVSYMTRQLGGYYVKIARETKDKVTRAMPVSAQAEAGNIKLVDGPWVKPFLRELVNFPDGRNDDQVDTLANGFNYLSGMGVSTGCVTGVRPGMIGGPRQNDSRQRLIK